MWKTLRDGFPAVFSSVRLFLYRFSRIFAVDSIYLIRTLIAALTKIRKVRPLTLALWVGFLGVRLSPVSARTADRAVRVPTDTTEVSDSIPATRFLHRLEFDAQPLFVLPTNVFVKGYNEAQQAVRAAGAAHVDYGIQLHPATVSGRVYGSAYQGVGVGHYAFDNRRELGAAWAVYLYQGARLFAFTPRLSLDYRWNFGFSFGWHPFDVDSNPYNRSLGSPFNAYLDANLMLRWAFSPQFDLTAGATFAHFSNGSTTIPNAGLNTLGLRVGLAYTFRREADPFRRVTDGVAIPEFPRHWSYDLVAFGSWRQRGYARAGEKVVIDAKYAVAGVSFAPMYNLDYRFRLGAALDAVYDASGNRVRVDESADKLVLMPDVALRYQLALGLSGRVEYVMPWLTLSAGVGYHVLSGGGDMRNFYQILALKVDLTHSAFLHVGYNLRNFHEPNYLMLGLGYRFHDLTPRLYRLLR